MRISDWSSDVCSSDLAAEIEPQRGETAPLGGLVEFDDHPVVHRAARGGMRMEDHRHRRARARRGGETAFETAFGAGKDDFGHNTRWLGAVAWEIVAAQIGRAHV